MENKLFVGSLPWSTKGADLTALFSKAGTVVSADVMVDRETGRSRGSGFVTMQTPEEAAQAVSLFNNTALEGRTIVVNIARPKESRPPFRERSQGYSHSHSHGHDHGHGHQH